MFRTAFIALLTLAASVAPCFAAVADRDVERSNVSASSSADVASVSTVASESTPSATPMADSVAAFAGDTDWSLPPIHLGQSTERPTALPALYAGLAALQVYDGYSTHRGLALGAQEANPLMQAPVRNSVTQWGVKVAAAAVPMILAERMWHHNRAGAIVVMVLANGVSAMIAANNARALGQLR
jgi:hypothetical protein